MGGRDVAVQIRQKSLAWREVDGVVIALDLVSSTYLTTNRTGRILWNALIPGATVPGLVALLQSNFGISEEVATEDVAAFLKLLDSHRLLERIDQSGATQGRRPSNSA